MLALLVPLASAEVFVDVDEAQALIEAGASVVDARGPRRWRRGHVPGSAPLSWWRLRDGWRVRNGRLSEDLGGLQDALEEAGVRADRPALVVGAAAEGWGEEGRILWTLEVLGHPEVYILDGGVGAWVEAGQPLARGRQRPPRGDFSPTLRPELRADTARVAASDAHIWDARSREEFLGATPAGERRGGHVPGAKSLYWRELIDDDGRLLPEDELERRLTEAGLPAEVPVITLCTGGVRAGFAYAVLRHLERPTPAVYDASMWAWSADPALPLETTPP